MTKNNFTEGVTGEMATTYAIAPFPRQLTLGDFKAIKEIIDQMSDIIEKMKAYDYYVLSVDFLKELGDEARNKANNAYALRFYAEGIVTALEQNENTEYFSEQINSLLDEIFPGNNSTPEALRSHWMMKPCHDSKCDQTEEQTVTDNMYKAYKSLIKSLHLDDFHDIDDFKLQNTIEDIEHLFFYWVHKNDYKKLLPNLNYIREPQFNRPSKGYMILRNEFNEELLKSIPSKGKGNGILLLKMAYGIQSYDPPMALKYVIKARSIFLDCYFVQGITWIDGFYIDTMNM